MGKKMEMKGWINKEIEIQKYNRIWVNIIFPLYSSININLCNVKMLYRSLSYYLIYHMYISQTQFNPTFVFRLFLMAVIADHQIQLYIYQRIFDIINLYHNHNIRMSEKNSNADKNSIHQLLIDASCSHNLEEVKRLIKAGANPNYVRYTDTNGWYSGNTHTALYSAVHADFKDNETNYVNVLEALLNAGANPNFKAVRGNWNHCTQYPLFSGVAYKLAKFKSESEKIRFIQIFVKHGININQSQNHSRSKNWRAYRTHTCFLFQILDMVGVRSKVGCIQKKFYKQSIQRMQQQRQKKLQQEFNRENPGQKIGMERREQIQNEVEKEQIKKQPQLGFVQALINFGADPNSYKSQSFWENYNSDYYQGNQDQQAYAKFDQSISQVHETILHRAIMNNLPSLVKLLLSKGANLTTCKLTIKTPVYPNDWPQKLKQRKIEQNRKSIKSNEEQKNKIKEALQKCEDENERKEYLTNIRHYQFQIFKAKRFVIQNQLPIPVCEVKEISCEEITHILDVSEDIKQMLAEAAKLPHNQKP